MDHPGPTHRRGLNERPPLQQPLVGELLQRCAFPAAGTPLDCAVSGGPDSLALLVLAAAAGCSVTAIHVDHGLRPGSELEAQVVARAASAYGAKFRAETVEVEPGPNLEARARAARLGVLPSGVCTGHTADDRAETMLLNLLRGAGPGGLAALSPGPRHPILALRRHETVALCGALGLAPVKDPSNRDPGFRRNRVRHELLPLLADIADRDPVPVLTRQGDLFVDLVDDLNRLAARIDPTSAASLRDAPVSLARVAVRHWLLEAGVGQGYVVNADAVERVLEVARLRIKATEVTGGWRVTRSRGRLALEAPKPAN